VLLKRPFSRITLTLHFIRRQEGGRRLSRGARKGREGKALPEYAFLDEPEPVGAAAFGGAGARGGRVTFASTRRVGSRLLLEHTEGRKWHGKD
jgi:hypothetical protein